MPATPRHTCGRVAAEKEDDGIAFALVSQAPVDELEAWRTRRGWDRRWVSSYDTTYHDGWGWTPGRLAAGADVRSGVEARPGLIFRDDPVLIWFAMGRGTQKVVTVRS